MDDVGTHAFDGHFQEAGESRLVINHHDSDGELSHHGILLDGA